MPDQEAETVARTFYAGWICRFGTPLRVTTDQGRQFESHLFQSLSRLTGTTRLRTTAYHPQANGMVERLHRQLKAAIRCHQDNQWTKVLPTVLLGIRAAWRDDLQATSAELVYGESLRLPGEFLRPSSQQKGDQAAFITELRQHLQDLRPTTVRRHGTPKTFIFKDLATTKHVLLRHDAVKNSLDMPYDGPYPVVSRNDKTFVVKINGRDTTVTIERLKPAYILTDESDDQGPPALTESQQPPIPQQEPPQTPAREQQSPQPVLQNERMSGQPTAGRSRRCVRFTERYQAGFN